MREMERKRCKNCWDVLSPAQNKRGEDYCYDCDNCGVGELYEQIAKLRNITVGLRDALEPFARQADIIDGNDKADGNGPEDDAIGFRFRGSYTAICLGDCRRAKAAAEEK
jgi:hypothetical protein